MQTTTINCLTGVIPASGGDALVYGEALSSTGGMDRIRSIMGVCPQFDVLWSELTGLEHLTIYGNIKVLLHTLSDNRHGMAKTRVTVVTSHGDRFVPCKACS